MTDQELHKLANDLRVACQIISRRVRFEGTNAVAPHQASVLGKVLRGPLGVGELASSERVSAPSMTRTVNCLAEQGLIEKVPHATDGRQVLVQITDAGRAAMQQAVADRDCWMSQRLAELGPDKLERLRELVPLLSDVAQA